MKKAINWILNRRMVKPVVVACMTEQQKQKYYMLQFRAHMQFFGCDVSDMTDEEIMEGHKRVGEVMSASGVTVEQAGEALKLMSESIKTP